jgi:hypothetical protein
MSQAEAVQMVNVDLDTLVDIIRQVVREEVSRAVTGGPDESKVVYLEPGSPLYEDMLEIQRLAERGEIRVMSREEAFRDIG